MEEKTFYKITLSTLPEIRAVSVKPGAPVLKNHQAEREPNVCHICYLQAGTLTEISKNGEFTLEAGCINAFTHNHRRKFVPNGDEHHAFHIIFTLGAPAVPISSEELAQWAPLPYEAVLPGYITDQKICQKLAPMIRRIVQDCSSTAPTHHLSACTVLFEILTILTDYSLRCTQEQNCVMQKEVQHCRSACDYIAENLGRKLTIKDIAEHVGISYYYLCRLFPKVVGINMTEYINREKLQHAQHLIAEVGLTVEKASSAVGIDDPKYFSRLFRQYAGMTISEFKRLHKQ